MRAETDGVIRLAIEIRIDTREMSGWSPERIAAFFDGIGSAITARMATQSPSPESPKEGR